jgi:hypothetical protein
LNANADGKAENRNCAVFLFFVFAAKCDNFNARRAISEQKKLSAFSFSAKRFANRL